MPAYVICCNDNIKHVVLNSEVIATAKLQELKDKFFLDNQFHYKNYEEYEQQCYWHLHNVPYTNLT